MELGLDLDHVVKQSVPHRIGINPHTILLVLASSAADRWFEPSSGQTKTMNLVFVASSISTQNECEKKDWLAWTRDNVFVWGDISVRGLLFL